MSKSPRSAYSASATALNDLPDVILSNIFALLTDTRSRNSLSLVCRKYCALDRATRTSLSLRGNVKDLYLIPTGFRSVTSLDLSLLSPWGHDLLSSVSDPVLLADVLAHSLPLVDSLTIYSRSPSTLLVLLPRWPLLRHLKLVRWHQRPHAPLGADFNPVFAHCRSLLTLDVSSFYYYTEDLHPVLQEYPLSSGFLTKLDLLTVSFSEGFKSQEIKAITSACGNLKELLLACTFDTRYNGYVGDEALLDIAVNCPKLSVLYLVDTSSLLNIRGDPEDDGFTSEDAEISHATMVEFFSRLVLLEELVLDVCKNVRHSGMALEVLNSKCPNLKLLKLGQFHEVVMAIDSRLDGLARCHGLVSLSIKNSGDLTDEGLIEIARGCCKLAKFEIQGCKNVTWKGMRTLTSLLRRSLIDVSISCCKNLGAITSLRSVEPIRHRIQRLHIDCVWDGVEFVDDGGSLTLDLNEVADATASTQRHDELMPCAGNTDYEDTGGRHKKCKYMVDLDAYGQYSYHQTNGNANGILGERWDRLRYLSLWISIGELLAPLLELGLDDCPNLEEIRIKVEGDCRGMNKPTVPAFGLNNLVGYPALTKLQLDCGEVLGYALTAPSGQMDLTVWDRFFLNGIADLSIDTLDYWPPQDRDVNQRSLSMSAAGLLSESQTLRKIFIHGTAHEHSMNFLLKIPSLRDAQLRADYYPAPENDMSTEMRVGSCNRFEEQLNRRVIPD